MIDPILVIAMSTTILVTRIRTNTRMDHLITDEGVWQCECGVAPAECIEYPSRNTLDINQLIIAPIKSIHIN